MRTRIITAIALGALLTTAACGDDDSGETDTATDTVADTSTDTTTSPPDSTTTTTDATDPTDGTTATDATTDGDTDVVEGAGVVVNEVYGTGSDDWIELYNAGDAAVDISGWTITDDDPTHVYTFPNDTIIPAGVYFLVERGENGFDFGLGGADAVNLLDGATLVDATAWTDGDLPDDFSWGRLPNGSGAFETLFVPTPGAANVENEPVICDNGSLEPTEACDGTDFGGVTCESLGFAGGTLACLNDCTEIGTDGCTPIGAALVINEVAASGDDQIELFNGTAAAIDLSGYTLSDDNLNVYVIPGGTTIAAGGYLVFVKGVDHEFGVGGDDAIELRDDLAGVIDLADWEEGQAEISYCRLPNGTGGFQACATATFGAANE